jgi:hypothetical protein
MKEDNWSWVEALLNKIPLHYLLFSWVLLFILYLIFVFFNFKVVTFKLFSCKDQTFELHFWSNFTILAMCLLIFYQLSGIKYLLDNIRNAFLEIKLDQESKMNKNDLYNMLEYKFMDSHFYYLIIGLSIIPFIFIDLTRPWRGFEILQFYHLNQTTWSLLLDIYLYAVSYSINLLMGIIVWIIINITWMFSKLGNAIYRSRIHLDLLAADNIGGLGQLKNLVLKVFSYYFICISLAILTYINPFSFISYESIFFIMLFLIGICFVFTNFYFIHKILKEKVDSETNDLEDIFVRRRARLIDIISRGDYRSTDEELKWLSTVFEAIDNEMNRLNQINLKVFDFKTVVAFLSTSLFPILTKLLQDRIFELLGNH